MLYRRKRLCEYLNNLQIKNLLKRYDYPKQFSLQKYLKLLRGRIALRCCETEKFSHEIGAFLGYPIHDIYGFINNRDEQCLLTGEWKVYADADNAKNVLQIYGLP